MGKIIESNTTIELTEYEKLLKEELAKVGWALFDKDINQIYLATIRTDKIFNRRKAENL